MRDQVAGFAFLHRWRPLGDRQVGLLLAAIVLALYGVCLPSAPAAWDSAELQTVPYILGIPHPTGFPAFVLIGWLFSHDVAFGSVAWRMNLLCAACLAVATLAVFVAARICNADRFGALCGAALFAAGEFVLGKALHTDVHAMSTMWFALALASLLAYVQAAAPRYLYRGCAFVGLGLATHPTAVWWLPTIALALIYRRKTVRPATLVRALVLLDLPLALYLYLPIRSAFVADPNASLGLGDAFAAFWNTNNPSTWSGFSREVSGSDFGAGATLAAVVNVSRYPEYFTYWLQNALTEFGWPGLALAVLGVLALLRWNPTLLSVLVVAGSSGVPFAVAYRAVEGDVARYFLPSFVVCGVAAALAPTIVSAADERRARIARTILHICQLVALGLLITTNWRAAFSERLDSGGTATIEAIRHGTPSNALVVTLWVDATSLAYAAYVERSLGERRVISAWPGAIRDALPRLSTFGPLYILVPDDFKSNVSATVPNRWLTRLGATAPGHALYQVCKVQRMCEEP